MRRYTPRSRRSISNSCPGSIPSRFRSSAGRTICPLVEIVVFMVSKITSYFGAVKRRERWPSAPVSNETLCDNSVLLTVSAFSTAGFA